MVTTLSALMTRTVSVLDTEERKENMLFVVGKDLKHVVIMIPHRKTIFLRVIITVKVY